MRVALLWLGLCAACHKNEGGGGTPSDTHKPTDTGTPSTTGTTDTVTWDTSHPVDTGYHVDCSHLPTDTVPYETFDITTEEDFDFDFDGYVVYQSLSDLVGRNQYGDFKVISPNISSDASGIQVVSSGDIVVCSPDTDVLKYVDHLTGLNHTLIGGLNFPNGLEVGSGDLAYWSELSGGRIGWINTKTLDSGIVSSEVTSPNGISLSADEQTMYVAADSGGVSGLLALDRIVDQEWSAPRMVLPTTATFDGVETDVCGNVYTVEFDTGHLLRVDPTTGDSVLLADLDDTGFSMFSALRWGNGIGGWDQNILYVTNRNKMFAVHVEAFGTPDPVDAP